MAKDNWARQASRQKISLKHTALEALCPARETPVCVPASERYRTHDGTCNNKRRLRWGSAQMPFHRFLPPEYGDGVESIRNGVAGEPLFSSRFVSLLVHGARDGEAPLTVMFTQWGQLLDHDMTSTMQPRSINGSIPRCCGGNDFHPSCFPIKIPLDDPWLSPLKVRCLEFLRSAPAHRRDCILSWREQSNQATSYIDASPIYSNNVKIADKARAFRNGLLLFGRGNSRNDVCHHGGIGSHCIKSGDARSGEQPGLLALHQVWVLEHNLIAQKLSEMNLHWSDEKLYQETRKIIGAMFQHITYREFLPVVLGRDVLKIFGLELLNTGYYEGYDGKINPTVANAFSTAAFRFGHSLVQNMYLRCDRFHNFIKNNVSLHEEFQRGDIGTDGSLHRLIRGMSNQRTLIRDEFISPELTNHLFQTPGFPFGLDLAAINIQRGRDHGIPPYTRWRSPCGLPLINSWVEFANVVGPESARRISHAYKSIHDVDLFVGGIAERPVAGGLVGPTFACIIAQQFSNARRGDRFWYENGQFENAFTPAQLQSIRRVSLAQVLCRAAGGGTFQPHIFIPVNMRNNARLPCGKGPLAEIDLRPWLERDPFLTQNHQNLPQIPLFSPTVVDRIFDIMVEAKNKTALSLIKKQQQISFAKNISNTFNLPDKASFSMPGFSNSPGNSPRNVTKISDKLDLKKTVVSGHQVNKQKPLPGISNKLDKRKPVGIKGSHHTLHFQNAVKRTAILNTLTNSTKDGSTKNLAAVSNLTANVVEDRDLENLNCSPENSKVAKENCKLTNSITNFNSELESKQIDGIGSLKQMNTTPIVNLTAEFEGNLTDLSINSSHTKANRLEDLQPLHFIRTLQFIGKKDLTDIDPMMHASLFSHKRVQRNQNLPKKFTDTFHIPLTASVVKANISNGLLINETLNDGNLLRRYQTSSTYSRPHKIFLNNPIDNQQYEIQISIKQSGKTTKPFSAYTTKPQSPSLEYGILEDFDRSTSIYSYYQPTTPHYTITRRTKPPTIIIIDDDNRYSTRKKPGWTSTREPYHDPEAYKLQHSSPVSNDNDYHNLRPPSIQNAQDIYTQVKFGVVSQTQSSSDTFTDDSAFENTNLNPISNYFAKVSTNKLKDTDIISHGHVFIKIPTDSEGLDISEIKRKTPFSTGYTRNNFTHTKYEGNYDLHHISEFSSRTLRPLVGKDSMIQISDNTKNSHDKNPANSDVLLSKPLELVNNTDFYESTRNSSNVLDKKLQSTTSKRSRRERQLEGVSRPMAFTSMQIVTKPERPDKWVIFDAFNNQPLLPQMPEILADSKSTIEFPSPIAEESWMPDLANNPLDTT